MASAGGHDPSSQRTCVVLRNHYSHTRSHTATTTVTHSATRPLLYRNVRLTRACVCVCSYALQARAGGAVRQREVRGAKPGRYVPVRIDTAKTRKLDVSTIKPTDVLRDVVHDGQTVFITVMTKAVRVVLHPCQHA